MSITTRQEHFWEGINMSMAMCDLHMFEVLFSTTSFTVPRWSTNSRAGREAHARTVAARSQQGSAKRRLAIMEEYQTKQTTENVDDPPNSRLFVVTSRSITEDEVRESFAAFGDIQGVWVVKDRQTKESKGICYVKFAKSSQACLAMEEMHGKVLVEGTKPIKVSCRRCRWANQAQRGGRFRLGSVIDESSCAHLGCNVCWTCCICSSLGVDIKAST